MKPIVCKIKRTFRRTHIGSAEWRDAKDIAEKRDKNFQNNMILTQSELISKNMKKSGMNRHVILIGRPRYSENLVIFLSQIYSMLEMVLVEIVQVVLS